MYEQNILDQQAFAREATIASAVANPYLESGKVLIAETGLFYDVVTTNSTGAIALTNGKFLKHIENLKINGNVLKGSITINASQVPQDANNRFITDTERTNWNNKSNKTVQMIAGNGLTGGGTLEANRTFNVVSANDGIVVNADNIQLNPVNALNSTSATRPLTAAQGKVLEDKKLNLSGGTMSGNLNIKTSDATRLVLERNNTKTSNNNINFKYSDAEYFLGYINGTLRHGEQVDLTSSARIYDDNYKPLVDAATKLQTARQINGTNFDGTGNITTANWGTARTLTIGSTGKSVNGSANVSWSLAELGLGNVNNTADSAKNVLSATKLTTARTINGVSFDGTSNINVRHSEYIGVNNTVGTNGYGLSLYGGAVAGAPSYGLMFQQTGTFGTHGSVTSDWATYFTMAGSTNRGWIFKTGNSSSGNIASISATGVITANTFSGNLSGNSSTATKLQTARTIGGVSFDGTANINLPGVNTAGNQSTSGNAATATKLQTTRAINGTNFDGTAAITTAHWGTARTLTIGNTGKSVNGSGNVSWSTREIGALPLNTVNGCPNPAYYLSTSTSTTRTKIRLPYKSNAGKMVVFTIRVYQDYQHFDLQISGYLYGSTNQWYLPKATMISGTISVEVKMGRDTDGYAYVSINGGNYRGVAVIDVVGGYSNADWSTGWLITATNDLANVEYTITVYPPYSPNNKPTATDVGLGNVPNTVHTTAATANTVAVRDSSGDINVRLLRPNYADQSTISGAMAFRINNGSDNYIRFCNNATNIRNWLGAAASSHTHSISQITGGTHSTITMTPNNTSGTYNTRSIELREVNNVTTGQSSDAYAPAIGWHWGGRYGKKLFMNASGRLVFDGDFSASKVYNAIWNDYAEYFPKLETTITEAGDIIALSLNDDGEFYELATEDHVMIVGAHSDQFGHIIGGENPENGESFEEYNNKKFIPVGLVGRLPVKFVGTARKGMKVVPSHIPGVGRKFDSSKDDYDKVIGYIVENNNDEGIRRVKIKIGK